LLRKVQQSHGQCGDSVTTGAMPGLIEGRGDGTQPTRKARNGCAAKLIRMQPARAVGSGRPGLRRAGAMRAAVAKTQTPTRFAGESRRH
jgi:hypothetical protein